MEPDEDASIHRRLIGALGTAYTSPTGCPRSRAMSWSLPLTPAATGCPRGCTGHAVVLALAGETEASAAAAGEAVRCLRHLRDQRGEAIGLAVQARLLNQEGTRDARAGELAAAGLRLSVASHDPRLQALLRCEFAVNQFYLGRLDKADALLSEIVPEIQRSDSFTAMTALGAWVTALGSRPVRSGGVPSRRGIARVARYANERVHRLPLDRGGAGRSRSGCGGDRRGFRGGGRKHSRGPQVVMSHLSAPEQQLLDHARAQLGQPGVAEATSRGEIAEGMSCSSSHCHWRRNRADGGPGAASAPRQRTWRPRPSDPVRSLAANANPPTPSVDGHC